MVDSHRRTHLIIFSRDGLIHYRSSFIPVKDLPRTLVWVGAIEFYVANSDWRSKKSWLFLWPTVPLMAQQAHHKKFGTDSKPRRQEQRRWEIA